MKNVIFPWLPRLLDQVAQGDPESRLFDHSYSEILQQFRITTYRIGLPKLVMYQARHSGASLDRQGRFRDILDVKKRGGWASDSSLRRYENAPLLNKSASDLSPKQLSLFSRADNLLEDIFFGRKAAMPMLVR